MASNRPKLEFVHFQLEHSSGNRKTFYDFLTETGKCTKKTRDKNAFAALYKYFMEQATSSFAKVSGKKTVFTVIGQKNNRFWDKKPQPNFKEHVISGVVNAGDYGYDMLMSDINKKKETSHIDPSKSLLHYIYILVYLPLDSNVGFIITHANNSSSSIKSFMRGYVKKIFKVGAFKAPSLFDYCPKEFSDNYKAGAVITGMKFQKRITDAQVQEDNPIKDFIKECDVTITISPKNNSIPLNAMNGMYEWFRSKFFGSNISKYRIEEFDKKEVNTRNADTKTSKIFELNNLDEDFSPTVYLDDKVPFNEEEGLLDFEKLEKYCMSLFKGTILKDIRPDLDAQRIIQ